MMQEWNVCRHYMTDGFHLQYAVGGRPWLSSGEKLFLFYFLVNAAFLSHKLAGIESTVHVPVWVSSSAFLF